jgi:hypothetical protein
LFKKKLLPSLLNLMTSLTDLIFGQRKIYMLPTDVIDIDGVTAGDVTISCWTEQNKA